MSSDVDVFKLFPRPGLGGTKTIRRFWWRVEVWPNVKSVQARYREAVGRSGRCHGFVLRSRRDEVRDRYDVVRRHKSLPRGEAGMLCLARTKLDLRVVSHECTHLALYTFSFFNPVLNFDSDFFHGVSDETVAYLVGHYVEDVYDQLVQNGTVRIQPWVYGRKV